MAVSCMLPDRINTGNTVGKYALEPVYRVCQAACMLSPPGGVDTRVTGGWAKLRLNSEARQASAPKAAQDSIFSGDFVWRLLLIRMLAVN